MRGTTKADELYGLAGSDRMFGGRGSDILVGKSRSRPASGRAGRRRAARWVGPGPPRRRPGARLDDRRHREPTSWSPRTAPATSSTAVPGRIRSSAIPSTTSRTARSGGSSLQPAASAGQTVAPAERPPASPAPTFAITDVDVDRPRRCRRSRDELPERHRVPRSLHCAVPGRHEGHASSDAGEEPALREVGRIVLGEDRELLDHARRRSLGARHVRRQQSPIASASLATPAAPLPAAASAPTGRRVSGRQRPVDL